MFLVERTTGDERASHSEDDSAVMDSKVND